MTGLPDRALFAITLLLAACGEPPPAAVVKDGPAQRIVALSPHLTELVFAAGAGAKLVGVVSFSDHPDEARALTRVGDAFRLDLEALAAVKPDLILGWPSGNSPPALDRLRRLGYRIVELEPRRLDDVGVQIEAIGRLAGTEAEAQKAAATWRTGLAALRSEYQGAHPGRVFYQISPQPLITVNREHFIGQAIDLCGGRNIYADVRGLTPVVSVESVVAEAPDVIVASDFTREPGGSATEESPLELWRQWVRLPAVAHHRLYVIDPDLMSVPGPRLLAGITRLCALLNGPPAVSVVASTAPRFLHRSGTIPAT